MADKSYWTRTLEQRIDRRRAIAMTGGAAAAAAFLAACGGGGDGGGEESSSLVSKPVDTTKSAKKGGTFKDGTRTDASTFDVHTAASSEPRRQLVWSRLTKIKSGINEPATGQAEPDLFESFEFSGDKLTMTGKIRSNVKLDPRPPTSGRVVTAEDVVFSFKRLEAQGFRRRDYANSTNPAAPIISVTAVDPRTVVLKLAAPDADLLNLLAATGSGSFHILSTEVDGGYDIRGENRGSGPYYISEHVPSSRIEYTRNPGYYDSNIGFTEKWDVPIVLEYAQSLAQLRAGQVYRFPENLRPEDILPLKRDLPEMIMIKTDVATDTSTAMFGFLDSPKSQFRDERVRQAYSMSQDRDLWIDTFKDVNRIRSEGLEIDAFWNSCFLCHDFGWYLNPQSKEFGDNAKYYKHDIAEAKKLLSAAGHPTGFETSGNYISTGQYGRDYVRQIEVLTQMAGDAGMKFTPVLHNFTSGWPATIRDAVGKFEGIAWLNLSPLSDVGSYLALYHSKGSLFKGFTPDGKSTFSGDPYLDDITTKIKQEFDRPKRFAMAHEIQKYVAKTQYYSRMPGGATGFDIAWPAIGNYGVYRGGTYPDTYLWLDETKAPLKKA